MGVIRGPLPTSSAVSASGPAESSDSSASATEDELYQEQFIPGISTCKSNPKFARHRHFNWGYAALVACVVVMLVAAIANSTGQASSSSSTLRMPPPRREESVEDERIIDVPLVDKRDDAAAVPTHVGGSHVGPPSASASIADEVDKTIRNEQPRCAGPGACVLGGLLDCPQIVDVATDNLLKVGHKLLGEQDRELARGIVAESLRNFSSQLWIFAPQVATAIESIEISGEEREAVISWMSLLRDERVRSVGLDVAGVIRGSPTPDRDYLRQKVEEAMIPRLREMGQLRDQLLPEALPGVAGSAGQWRLTLDHDNVRSMESVSGDFIFDFELPQPRALSTEEKYFALFGGAFEEGRALLHFFELYVRAASPGTPMPALQRAMTLGAEPMAWPCQLSEHRNTSIDLMKSLLCPLKLAASGLDALRAVDSVLSASASLEAKKAREGHKKQGEEDELRAEKDAFYAEAEDRFGEGEDVFVSKGSRGSHAASESTEEAKALEEEEIAEQSDTWEDDAGDLALKSKSHAVQGAHGKPAPGGSSGAHKPSERDSEDRLTESCDGSGSCLLRGLLRSERAREAAARNIMRVAGERLLPADWEMARRTVQSAFENISSQLVVYAPAVADELGQIQLSAEERDSVLKVLELLSDLRVQRLGVEVAKAIRDSESTEKSHLVQQVATYLSKRREELSALREELIPEPLGSYWEAGHDWGLTMDSQNIKSMLPVDAETRAALESMRAPLATSLDDERKAFSMYGGALEEGRALLDILQRCVRAMGPHWTANLGRTMLFGEATLSWPCEPQDLDSTIVDFSKALLCPLKFGAQGLDALLATAPGNARPDDNGSEDGGRKQPPRPVRRTLSQLLMLPGLQKAAAENLLKAGGQHFADADGELALQVIRTSFANISNQLQVHAPQLARQLEKVELTEEFEEGLTGNLQLLRDPRVQVVGIEVAGAIRDCGRPERKYLKHCVEEFLREKNERFPELPVIAQLRDKLVKEPLRSSCVAGHHWGVALSPENVNELQAKQFNTSAPAEPATQPVKGKMSLEQKYFALFSGALEEARVLLDIMQKCNLVHSSHWTPEQEETGVRFGVTSLSRPCGLEDLETSEVDPTRVLLCPLKLGALGLDAITAPLPHPGAELS